jgi:hypothetical protein
LHWGEDLKGWLDASAVQKSTKPKKREKGFLFVGRGKIHSPFLVLFPLWFLIFLNIM